MNIDIDLINKKNFKNYNNKKLIKIIERYEKLIKGEYGRGIWGLFGCYYNKNNELIICSLRRNNNKIEGCTRGEIKKKLINDINKEKFKLSIYYMKKKLSDEIIYEISTYL